MAEGSCIDIAFDPPTSSGFHPAGRKLKTMSAIEVSLRKLIALDVTIYLYMDDV